MYIIRTKKCLEYRLRKDMRRGRLLDLEVVPRRIGKTSLLIKMANEYLEEHPNDHVTILQPTLNRAKCISNSFRDEISPKVDCQSVNLVNNNFLAYKDSLVILIDEGLSMGQISEVMKRYNVLGGYCVAKVSGQFRYICDGELECISQKPHGYEYIPVKEYEAVWNARVKKY